MSNFNTEDGVKDSSASSIRVFENVEFGKVRVHLIDGEPWFVGKDVASILGYTYPKDAVRDNVDEEDKTVVQLSDFQDGERGSLPDHMKGSKITIINESGLYSLILRSNMPSARKFKSWVTKEVLPAIRKTGYYGEMFAIPRTFSEALQLAADQARKIEEQQRMLEVQTPKAEYYDTLVERGTSTNIRDTAKELGIKEKKFIQLMIEWKILYRDSKKRLKPTAEAVSKGWCVLKEFNSTSNNYSGNQVLFTVEGKDYLRKRLPAA